MTPPYTHAMTVVMTCSTTTTRAIDLQAGRQASKRRKGRQLTHYLPTLLLLPYDDGDAGKPSYCLSSAEVNNGATSCYLDDKASNATHKAYRRTRNRFLTGYKGDVSHLAALDRYEGATEIMANGVGTYLPAYLLVLYSTHLVPIPARRSSCI